MDETSRRSPDPKLQSAMEWIRTPDRGYSRADVPRGSAFSRLHGDPNSHSRRAPQFPESIFLRKDFEGIECPHEDPLVITLVIKNFEVGRMLVDTGSSVDILLFDACLKLGMSQIRPVATPLAGFT
ncbi:hypothetical protein LIER_25877 [Lithospermum erythrorhizon]|uniref:Uncharacterized protein n=1 Tax=Lithospermum erythrorhizon TaxID=34254 RepID=A0AAV3RCB1_LITER